MARKWIVRVRGGVGVLAVAAMVTSCSVLRVHRGGKTDGVPFYVRTAVCRHEVTWLEPVYTLTLEAVSSQGATQVVTNLGSAEFSLSSYSDRKNRADISSLKQAVESGQDPMGMWASIQTKGTYNPVAQADPQPGDIVLVSNVNKVETTVDYRDPYYFNAHRPLIGTAKADIKLATDGTMGEASAEVESKTLQSFLDLLPIKQLVSTAAGIKAAGGGAPLTYRLQIESKAIKHTHYRYQALNASQAGPPCPALPAAAFSDPSYNREREDAAKPEKTSDKNAVQVNGEIKLPHNAGDK